MTQQWLQRRTRVFAKFASKPAPADCEIMVDSFNFAVKGFDSSMMVAPGPVYANVILKAEKQGRRVQLGVLFPSGERLLIECGIRTPPQQRYEFLREFELTEPRIYVVDAAGNLKELPAPLAQRPVRKNPRR